MASETSAPSTGTGAIVDDKSPHCIPFILSLLSAHQATEACKPFFIGLNGIQGAGKTTLVGALAALLTQAGHPTLVFSIDDLYLTRADQRALAAAHPLNPLVQHRGEPGTHDLPLARDVLARLARADPCPIPQYDKSRFGGMGDRVPREEWVVVNPGPAPADPQDDGDVEKKEKKKKVEIVILEGWCVGFRPLTEDALTAKWRQAQTAATTPNDEARDAPTKSTLHTHRLEDLLFVNAALRGYDVITDALDAFIHLDALDTSFVYDWRLQQEAALRSEKGQGMSDDEVVRFVDGYYPAYELFTDGLRSGVFAHLGKQGEGRQLRLIVGKDRLVKEALMT